MRVLFYSSVSDLSYFNTQSFYVNDINVLESLGYEVIVTNKFLPFFFFWKYEVSFLYFYRKSLIPAMISKIFFKKVFFTGGIDDLDYKFAGLKKYSLQKILFNVCCIFSNRCFIVSNSDFENAVNSIYFYKNRLVLSFHSVDLPEIKPDSKCIRSLDFTTVCWMGSVENVKRKGVDRSLFIFSQLIKIDEFKDSNFHVIGFEGPGHIYLKNIISSLCIEDKVFFHGSVSDDYKFDLLLSCKFYFQISLYEGFGLAALESLYLGNCVIHSNAGGLKDTVGNMGIIVDVNYSDEYCTNLIVESFDKFEHSDNKDFLINKFSHKKRRELFKKYGL